jgi:hypothetical protein
VDCIIATSAALRELLRPANGHADFGDEGHSDFATAAYQGNSIQSGSGPQPATAAPMFDPAYENRIPIFSRKPISSPNLILSKDNP